MRYKQSLKSLFKYAFLFWFGGSTYVTIERVESAMAELEEVFRQESGRTRALQLMEEIKGCLISLLF